MCVCKVCSGFCSVIPLYVIPCECDTEKSVLQLLHVLACKCLHERVGVRAHACTLVSDHGEYSVKSPFSAPIKTGI
jgi:hypothetical protein